LHAFPENTFPRLSSMIPQIIVSLLFRQCFNFLITKSNEGKLVAAFYLLIISLPVMLRLIFCDISRLKECVYCLLLTVYRSYSRTCSLCLSILEDSLKDVYAMMMLS
jgi:hypothetical protein